MMKIYSGISTQFGIVVTDRDSGRGGVLKR